MSDILDAEKVFCFFFVLKKKRKKLKDNCGCTRSPGACSWTPGVLLNLYFGLDLKFEKNQ